MFTGRRTLLQVLLSVLFILFLGGTALSQGFSAALEQEFMDARAALAAAQTVKAEQYEPEQYKSAAELLRKAETARSVKDEVLFTQSSRLARVYAESSKAWAELKAEQEKLAVVQGELEKIKAEIQRLRKAQ